jgi:hypothetical protein
MAEKADTGCWSRPNISAAEPTGVSSHRVRITEKVTRGDDRQDQFGVHDAMAGGSQPPENHGNVKSRHRHDPDPDILGYLSSISTIPSFETLQRESDRVAETLPG